MRGFRTIFVGLALIGAANFLFPNAASAEFFGCHDKPGQVLSYDGHRGYASARMTQEFAAQTARPRVVIHPRRIKLSQNSVRQCRSTLVKEYRLSGAVFVPHMQCWWE